MVVRGDNYCAIRSNLFQAFTVENLTHCPLLGNMGSIAEVQKVSLLIIIIRTIIIKYTFETGFSNHLFSEEKSKKKAMETLVKLEFLTRSCTTNS